ncbi:MAG: hypothetical protein JXR62_03140 [Bacilli bacterium]|nr:hypothetical protein [Bacilli bacterium]
MFGKKKITAANYEPEIMTKEMELEYKEANEKEELNYQRKFGKRKVANIKPIDEKSSRKEKMNKRLEESRIQDSEVLTKKELEKAQRIKKRDKSSKKDLSSYFEKSKKKNKKLVKKEYKGSTSSNQINSATVPEEVEDIKVVHVYKFRDKKFFKVENFISYLEDHYLEIDKIAKEVLDDEDFYGWINHNSAVFPESLRYFKELKEIIEKK